MALRLMIPEIFEACRDAKNDKERVAILQANDHPVLRTILKAAFDPNYVWDLPEGLPPLKLDRDLPKGFSGSNLYAQARLLYIFPTSYNKIKRPRKEQLFVNLLEGLHWTEADFVCDLKEGKLPVAYKVTEKLVGEAFPSLMTEKTQLDHIAA